MYIDTDYVARWMVDVRDMNGGLVGLSINFGGMINLLPAGRPTLISIPPHRSKL